MVCLAIYWSLVNRKINGQCSINAKKCKNESHKKFQRVFFWLERWNPAERCGVYSCKRSIPLAFRVTRNKAGYINDKTNGKKHRKTWTKIKGLHFRKNVFLRRHGARLSRHCKIPKVCSTLFKQRVINQENCLLFL